MAELGPQPDPSEASLASSRTSEDARPQGGSPGVRGEHEPTDDESGVRAGPRSFREAHKAHETAAIPLVTPPRLTVGPRGRTSVAFAGLGRGRVQAREREACAST